jgi:hypothetical protein
MNLTPLGWSLGRLIYMVANSTDTSIYASAAGHAKFLGIMVAQPVVTASLSPAHRVCHAYQLRLLHRQRL